MKRIIASAAALAILAACAQEAEEVVEEEIVEEAPAMTLEDHVGTWDVVYADGTEGTSTINADGTYSRTVGEDEDSGTWTFEDGVSCFTADGSEESRCYTIGAADENGTRVATLPDGAEVVITPAAAEDAAEGEATE